MSRPSSSGAHRPTDGGPGVESRGQRYSGAYSEGNGSSRGSRPSSGQSYHFDDLRNEAQCRIRELGPVPLKHLIDAAMYSLRSAESLLDQRRRDQAYIEFLVAYDIAVEQVPRHRGWPDLKLGRNQLYHMYRDLMTRLQLNDERFQNIRDIILHENKRTSARPRSIPSSVTSSSRPSTADGSQGDRNSRSSDSQNETTSTDGYSSSTRPLNATTDYSGRSTPTGPISKFKPPIRPKPEALHGHVIPHERSVTNGGSTQDLAERFARLRGPSAATTDATQESLPGSLAVGNSFANGPIFSTPHASEFSPSVKTATLPPSLRPAGPRNMPAALSGPEHGQRPPLDTAAAMSMPKPPSPTYSPARNMQTPAGVHPPRSTARSTVGTGGRSNSVASSISSKALEHDSDAAGHLSRPNGHTRDNSRRKGSVGLPTSDRTIKADVLYDCLNLYNVLLIDVRPRDQFDRGHIDHSSILCIEPLTLRQSMSAEELQNALVLSPDVEPVLFDRRDQFDLVVYYDQSTENTQFLTNPIRTTAEDALRTLFDALWEFNAERPLKKPPLLLAGGLRSWETLLGRPALATSDTAATKASKEGKASRKVVAPPSASQRFAIEKKRRREFNPIEADELRKWEERARQESLQLDLPLAEEDEETDVEENDEDAAFYRTQEDFLRRYPAISLEQESMVQPHRPDHYPPTRTPPRPPSYPPSENMPEFPSRPRPTAPRVSYSGAHERSVAPYNSQTRSSSLRPYVQSKDMPQNILLPKTGLINFGATCYMNATVQCLSATIRLTQFFRDGTYKRYIQRDSWKGTKGLLPENYANLVQHLWRGDVSACRPTTFRHFCARLNREWGLDRQQDAKEFFDFMLDWLHEDLNINWRNPPPHVLTAAEEAIREKMHKAFAAHIEWTRYQKRDKSMISDLFAGQHASRLRCLACSHTSTTYEAFYSISVEIPRQGAGDIYQCLASYCHEERLASGESWKCPACKKERDATKQITLTRAPKCLVVHFKRFRASHTESARKVSTAVAFPLTDLDIAPFMLAPPTPADAEASFRATGDPKWRDMVAAGRLDEASTGPFRYNAYAVIRHIGASVASGHYVAVTRDKGRDRWRVFNDDRVHDVDLKSGRGGADSEATGKWLQNEQAYIVFYERVP